MAIELDQDETPLELMLAILGSFRNAVEQTKTTYPGPVVAAHDRLGLLREIWSQYRQEIPKDDLDRIVSEIQALKVGLPDRPVVVPCPDCCHKHDASGPDRRGCDTCGDWKVVYPHVRGKFYDQRPSWERNWW